MAAMTCGGSRRPHPSSDVCRRCGLRKLVACELMSLDGVAEDPYRFFAAWDDAMDANHAAVAQDAVIRGRRSYDDWAGYRPGSDVEPFASLINGVAKHVVTFTPSIQELLAAGVVDELRLGVAPAKRRIWLSDARLAGNDDLADRQA